MVLNVSKFSKVSRLSTLSEKLQSPKYPYSSHYHTNLSMSIQKHNILNTIHKILSPSKTPHHSHQSPTSIFPSIHPHIKSTSPDHNPTYYRSPISPMSRLGDLHLLLPYLIATIISTLITSITPKSSVLPSQNSQTYL